MGGYVSRHVAWNELLSRIVSSPNLGKSRARKAARSSKRRGSATAAALCARNGLVATERAMPSVEGVSFSAADATITTTRSQKQDNCTDPQQPCNSDADCMRQPPVAYGLCEDGQCMQLGWCPRESPEVSQTTELQVARPLRPTLASRSLRAHRQLRVRASQNLRDLQVVLLGDIAFPRLGGPTFSTEDGRKVRTRWTLSDIVRRSGVPYATAVR